MPDALLTRYDTALFDLDGTLTDSAPGIMNAVHHALEKAHLPIPDPATLNRFIGPPLIDSFQRYCDLSHERAEHVLADYRAYYTERGLFENSVYPGVVAMLERHVAAGITCLVATAKPETFARRIVDHFGLLPYFAGVYGATLGEGRNTKEAVVAQALAQTGSVGRAVMIGDRVHDVNGARANGLPCIGVLWGYGNAAELAGANRLVRSPDELPFREVIDHQPS